MFKETTAVSVITQERECEERQRRRKEEKKKVEEKD
jgi:hypothetical protein